MRYFFLRPNTPGDVVATTLSSFLDEIVLQVEADPGDRLADLKSNVAIRVSFEERIDSEPHPAGGVLVFYGHGGDDCLIGYDGFAVISPDNAGKCREWHVYVVACLSARQLGPLCVGAGARSYIGYKGEWVLNRRSDGSAVEGWKETANAGLNSVLEDGKYDVRKVSDKILREYQRWIGWHRERFETIRRERPSDEFNSMIAEFEEMNQSLFSVWALDYNRNLLDYFPR